MSREGAIRAKLDENLGLRGANLLRALAWDVETVSSQDLCSADDRMLIEICRIKGRVLVTLDKDFSSTLRFPPRRYPGIVVLRLPEPLSRDAIDDALQRVVDAASGATLGGRLWIVDAKRIREFSEPELP